MRVAEVEAVRHRHGLGAGAGDVAAGLGHRQRAAGERIEVRLDAVAIGRERDGARAVPCTRSTAASPPGPMTVLVSTWWSYWRKIQRLEAISGELSELSSAALASGAAVEPTRSGRKARS